jgi:hypothetical protein
MMGTPTELRQALADGRDRRRRGSFIDVAHQLEPARASALTAVRCLRWPAVSVLVID